MREFASESETLILMTKKEYDVIMNGAVSIGNNLKKTHKSLLRIDRLKKSKNVRVLLNLIRNRLFDSYHQTYLSYNLMLDSLRFFELDIEDCEIEEIKELKHLSNNRMKYVKLVKKKGSKS